MMRQNDLSLLLMILLLSGCAKLSPARQTSLRINTQANALQAGFSQSRIATRSFLLTTYQKFTEADKTLAIYIEGDGRSYLTRTQVSPDPTPINPLALKLAILHPNTQPVAYLARPCQYTPQALDKHCTAAVWTDQRFSEPVIRSMNEAINVLKKKSKANTLHLIGFSGGAAVAVLIAARRNDVASLATVAGDLDPNTLSNYHHTTPLTDFINPLSVISNIIHIPQQHYAGEKDRIVPAFIAEQFVNAVKGAGGLKVNRIILKNATHHTGWEEAWLDLLQDQY